MSTLRDLLPPTLRPVGITGRSGSFPGGVASTSTSTSTPTTRPSHPLPAIPSSSSSLLTRLDFQSGSSTPDSTRTTNPVPIGPKASSSTTTPIPNPVPAPVPAGPKKWILRGCFIHLDMLRDAMSNDKYYLMLDRIYQLGGTRISEISDPRLTHIIINSTSTSTKSKSRITKNDSLTPLHPIPKPTTFQTDRTKSLLYRSHSGQKFLKIKEYEERRQENRERRMREDREFELRELERERKEHQRAKKRNGGYSHGSSSSSDNLWDRPTKPFNNHPAEYDSYRPSDSSTSTSRFRSTYPIIEEPLVLTTDWLDACFKEGRYVGTGVDEDGGCFAGARLGADDGLPFFHLPARPIRALRFMKSTPSNNNKNGTTGESSSGGSKDLDVDVDSTPTSILDRRKSSDLRELERNRDGDRDRVKETPPHQRRSDYLNPYLEKYKSLDKPSTSPTTKKDSSSRSKLGSSSRDRSRSPTRSSSSSRHRSRSSRSKSRSTSVSTTDTKRTSKSPSSRTESEQPAYISTARFSPPYQQKDDSPDYVPPSTFGATTTSSGSTPNPLLVPASNIIPPLSPPSNDQNSVPNLLSTTSASPGALDRDSKNLTIHESSSHYGSGAFPTSVKRKGRGLFVAGAKEKVEKVNREEVFGTNEEDEVSEDMQMKESSPIMGKSVEDENENDRKAEEESGMDVDTLEFRTTPVQIIIPKKSLWKSIAPSTTPTTPLSPPSDTTLTPSKRTGSIAEGVAGPWINVPERQQGSGSDAQLTAWTTSPSQMFADSPSAMDFIGEWPTKQIEELSSPSGDWPIEAQVINRDVEVIQPTEVIEVDEPEPSGTPDVSLAEGNTTAAVTEVDEQVPSAIQEVRPEEVNSAAAITVDNVVTDAEMEDDRYEALKKAEEEYARFKLEEENKKIWTWESMDQRFLDDFKDILEKQSKSNRGHQLLPVPRYRGPQVVVRRRSMKPSGRIVSAPTSKPTLGLASSSTSTGPPPPPTVSPPALPTPIPYLPAMSPALPLPSPVLPMPSPSFATPPSFQYTPSPNPYFPQNGYFTAPPPWRSSYPIPGLNCWPLPAVQGEPPHLLPSLMPDSRQTVTPLAPSPSIAPPVQKPSLPTLTRPFKRPPLQRTTSVGQGLLKLGRSDVERPTATRFFSLTTQYPTSSTRSALLPSNSPDSKDGSLSPAMQKRKSTNVESDEDQEMIRQPKRMRSGILSSGPKDALRTKKSVRFSSTISPSTSPITTVRPVPSTSPTPPASISVVAPTPQLHPSRFQVLDAQRILRLRVQFQRPLDWTVTDPVGERLALEEHVSAVWPTLEKDLVAGIFCYDGTRRKLGAVSQTKIDHRYKESRQFKSEGGSLADVISLLHALKAEDIVEYFFWKRHLLSPGKTLPSRSSSPPLPSAAILLNENEIDSDSGDIEEEEEAEDAMDVDTEPGKKQSEPAAIVDLASTDDDNRSETQTSIHVDEQTSESDSLDDDGPDGDFNLWTSYEHPSPESTNAKQPAPSTPPSLTTKILGRPQTRLAMRNRRERTDDSQQSERSDQETAEWQIQDVEDFARFCLREWGWTWRRLIKAYQSTKPAGLWSFDTLRKSYDRYTDHFHDTMDAFEDELKGLTEWDWPCPPRCAACGGHTSTPLITTSLPGDYESELCTWCNSGVLDCDDDSDDVWLFLKSRRDKAESYAAKAGVTLK